MFRRDCNGSKSNEILECDTEKNKNAFHPKYKYERSLLFVRICVDICTLFSMVLAFGCWYYLFSHLYGAWMSFMKWKTEKLYHFDFGFHFIFVVCYRAMRFVVSILSLPNFNTLKTRLKLFFLLQMKKRTQSFGIFSFAFFKSKKKLTNELFWVASFNRAHVDIYLLCNFFWLDSSFFKFKQIKCLQ